MSIAKSLKRELGVLDIGEGYPFYADDPDYIAWAFRTNDEYGVGFNYEGKAIDEEFAQVYLRSTKMNFSNEGVERNLLVLTTCNENALDNFSSICADFLDPQFRASIIGNPFGWWTKWKELIGNAVIEKKPYAVIGEMMVYQALKEHDFKEVYWGGPYGDSHDISTKDIDFEVKSTLQKYESIIHVSSQFQLECNCKKLFLSFCRFEKSEDGVSIEDMVDNLERLGCSRDDMNGALRKLGYGLGKQARNEKYAPLEIAYYPIDEYFPIITKHSFKNDVIPSGVEKFEYDVNLVNLEKQALPK